MKPTEPTNRDKARQQAIEWQRWMSDEDLSYSELQKWQWHFMQVASEFDLTDEFIENGII